MNSLKIRAASIATAGILSLGALITPAFAAETIQITGNGSSSTNNATVQSTQDTTVVQNNSANINNTVNNTANTGSNSASGNTGGDVLVLTGNSTSTTDITNKANLNVADVTNCGCSSDATVTISGNGSDSNNRANVTQNTSTEAFQNNQAYITNTVRNNSKTGYNSADGNTSSVTGGGTVTVLTGDANSTTTLDTAANANVLRIGSGGTGGNGTLSALISGNGSSSRNRIRFTDDSSVLSVQDNSAMVLNDVSARLKTGGNSADDNTGDTNITVDTGSASSNVAVDNMVNFNMADLDCGCLLDASAKISGNGTDSRNRIMANLDGSQSVFQGGREGDGNNANLTNWLKGKLTTGYNSADGNTASVLGDPVRVFTGNSSSTSSISNSGNVNVVGPSTMATLPGGLSLDFNFNLSSILSFLHMV